MFWFVFNTDKWRPDKEEAAKLLGPDVAFRLIDSFESDSNHPLFMLFYAVDGLRVFNLGVIEAEAGKAVELPATLLSDAEDRFEHIFGPFGDKDVLESLVRLNNYTLSESTAEDVLSMVSIIQGVRRKLSALGRLEKWGGRIEEMAACQGEIIDDMQHNRVFGIEHVLAPLNPVKTGKG